jgi:ribosomal protein S12 methylthiotransferase
VDAEEEATAPPMTTTRYWLETLGCPKNEVDSAKLAAQLEAEGYVPAESPEEAGLLVVNTCAFIEAAREESIEAVLELADAKAEGSRLVVTGCLAERHGDELAAAMPEVDLVAGFGVSPSAPSTTRVALRARADTRAEASLLELPRGPSAGTWAYVKAAEGCDRRCGFCAIPSFRGDQRSRTVAAVLAEVDGLVAAGTKEIVLIAQDLASYGLDRRARGAPVEVLDEGEAAPAQPLVELTRQVAQRAERVRLLYLYPSGLTEGLIEAIVATSVPYFDLSLQHASPAHLRRMRRWGSAERFLERIAAIRSLVPEAAFRSSFILGYPGETEADHDELLAFLEAAQLDWAGFFPFSPEEGTPAAAADGQVDADLALERLAEASALQDAITWSKRSALVGQTLSVLVDAPGIARSFRESPDIDGIVEVPEHLAVGSVQPVRIVEAHGVDLVGEPA